MDLAIGPQIHETPDQRLKRITGGVLEALDLFVDSAAEDLGEQIVLAWEVPVDRCVRDTNRICDMRHRRLADPLGQEQFVGGGDNFVDPVRAWGPLSVARHARKRTGDG